MIKTLELRPILPLLLLLVVGSSNGQAVDSRPHPSASAGSSPPIWGGALQWSCVVNMTDPADSPSNPHWTFNYTYDATGPDGEVDRYDHGAGQADEACKVDSVPTGEPCQVRVDHEARENGIAWMVGCQCRLGLWGGFFPLSPLLSRSSTPPMATLM